MTHQLSGCAMRPTSSRLPTPDAAAPVRHVVFVIFPGFEILDLSGPLSIFFNANRVTEPARDGEPAYRIEVVATRAGRVDSQQGLGTIAERGLPPPGEAIDTLVVIGGSGVHAAAEEAELVGWLRRTAPFVRRVCAVCTGAFLLARAGLLDGRRATTHWASCPALAKEYAAVAVEPDAIHVADGNVYTSAGITAGMDLGLALVEEDFGRPVAMAVARWLVMFAKRPGGQSQFSTHLAAQMTEHGPIRKLQEWVLDHLASDLSVPVLAGRAGMSPRNFARVFVRETGTTPADFVELARVEAARRQLEESALPVDGVARQCGFGTAEAMRRSFQRRLRISPQDYRARFRTPGGDEGAGLPGSGPPPPMPPGMLH